MVRKLSQLIDWLLSRNRVTVPLAIIERNRLFNCQRYLDIKVAHSRRFER